MGRIARELSALAVKQLTEPGMHAVGGAAGLYLFVSTTGARSWIARVTVDGKRREMGLGGFPEVSMKQAREKAIAARGEARAGVDPVAARKAAKVERRAKESKQKTFAYCAAAYIEAHSPAWRNAKHRAQWTSTLATYVYPTMGDVFVSEVTREDVLKVLVKPPRFPDPVRSRGWGIVSHGTRQAEPGLVIHVDGGGCSGVASRLSYP